ncbi:glycosyltransferase [Kineococcus sp. SYSU DK005]|uniref:glycosyltransferase n=1 Tax=Kineococcus sp. SYSU DK005 TaxID=3383126 RepID=UPI003D7D5517
MQVERDVVGGGPVGGPGGRVAVVVPCLDEEAAVGAVVDGLRAALPHAVVYVYDNGSTDRTAEVAARHGAVVRFEPRPGKGNVIRRAFADVDADTYVLIDGDDTYDASAAGDLVRLLVAEGLDHVVGTRRPDTLTAYRRGHAAGNRALNSVVSRVFGTPVTDMLSGYRVMSRRFVKSFPAISRGFEVETELTVHAVNLRVPQREVPVGFRDRPEGSASKLRTYRDGFAILRWILRLAHLERPLLVHALLGALVAVLSLALGLPVVVEFLRTGLVPKFPTAILASALMMIAVLVAAVGVVLDAVHRASDEASRLVYLQYPAPHELDLRSGPGAGADRDADRAPGRRR